MEAQQKGALLKTARLQKGYTQLELSERSGIGLRSIQRIENGSVQARPYTINALASQLDMDSAALYELKKIKHNQIEKPNNNIKKTFISIGAALLLLLGSGAFISQSPKFPETTFEMFSYWTAVTLVFLLILYRTWK